MATRKKPAKPVPAVRQAGLGDIRRWWKRKTRRARRRLAKKLHLTTTTKKMRPTPPPKQRATPAGPGLRTLGGKTVNATPTARAGTTAVHTTTGKAAPMTQRVKRTKSGQYNGSTAAKKTAAGKKTVAPNPEQRRLLAANKKAAQIDARLARTEQRIDRMYPEQCDQPNQSAADQPTGTPPSKPRKPRTSTTGATHVTNINDGGIVAVQAGYIDSSSSVTVGGEHVWPSDTHPAPPAMPRAKPRKPRLGTTRVTNVNNGATVGYQGTDVVGETVIITDGRVERTKKEGQ